jgi:hypothetical protein
MQEPWALYAAADCKGGGAAHLFASRPTPRVSLHTRSAGPPQRV